MSKKTVGYIVLQEGSAVWMENRKGMANGVLYFSREATLFPDRASAQRAIKRTEKYRAEHHAYDFGPFKIQRVVVP